jgi:RNA polymerase sigma factor (sigma-70 family)
VHDPRAGVARIQNVSVADLADEAFAWALESWKQKPTTTSPELWTRKHAHQLLDEALDAEALAAESRAEERATERVLLAHDLHEDDEERADWLDMAELAGRATKHDKDLGEDEPFDGLESDPQVSSPSDRLDGRETLVELERAMLGLPEQRRKAVAHRYLDGLSVEEIAYLLDSPAVAVEREIATGLAELQRALAAG